MPTQWPRSYLPLTYWVLLVQINIWDKPEPSRVKDTLKDRLPTSHFDLNDVCYKTRLSVTEKALIQHNDPVQYRAQGQCHGWTRHSFSKWTLQNCRRFGSEQHQRAKSAVRHHPTIIQRLYRPDYVWCWSISSPVMQSSIQTAALLNRRSWS